MGVIIADLKDEGTEPETSEAWTILVINDDKAGKHAFTKGVGRGSNSQVEDLDVFIRPTISEIVGSVIIEKTEWGFAWEIDWQESCWKVLLSNCWCIFLTLD